MSKVEPNEQEETVEAVETAEQPTTNKADEKATPFRRRRYVQAQTPDQSRRQSNLVQSAWRHFGEAAPMIAFLNTRNEALEALPLALALESDDGLERVQRLLKQMASEA